MIEAIFENLFTPNSDEEALKRKHSSSPFAPRAAWYKWVNGGAVAVLHSTLHASSRLNVAVLYEDEEGNEIRTDWPVQHASRKISYDYPEFLTPELKAAIEEAFAKKKELDSADD